jgi:uncharacterized protein
LSLILIICTVLAAVLFLMPPVDFLKSVWGTIIAYDTLKLLLIVACILLLSGCLRESGALEELVDSVRLMAKDNRFTMGLLPSLIGFLPVPGGALFSAPMIEKLADEANLTPDFRSFINYWFRHVWEYSYPLYPGLLLSSVILHVEIKKLIAFQFPLSLAAILAGCIFGLLKIPYMPQHVSSGLDLWVQIKKFLHGFWPVLFIVIGIFVIPWDILIAWTGLPFTTSTVASLVSENGKPPPLLFDPLMIILPVTVFIFGWPRLGTRKFFHTLGTSFDYRLPLTVLNVLIFKDVISHCGAVEELSTTFQEWGVPELALFIILPALMGYLTGITHSYVSVAFPLLLLFFGDPVNLAKVQLAYTAGFIGVILSPVHLCSILSCEYFHADFNKVLRMCYAPIAFVFVISLLIYFFR